MKNTLFLSMIPGNANVIDIEQHQKSKVIMIKNNAHR